MEGSLQEFEREVLERLIKIESKLDDINDLKDTADSNKDAITKNQYDIIRLGKDTDEQERRIADIENNTKWLWRTVTGAIITAFMGIVFTLIQAGMRR